MSYKIKLGERVVDPITGVQGIATVRVIKHNGNVRYSVQPLSPVPGVVADSWDIDEHTLNVIDEGYSAQAVPLPDYTGGIELGDEVQDRMSLLTGVAAARYEHYSGCVEFLVVVPREELHEVVNMTVGWQQLMITEKASVPRDPQVEEGRVGSAPTKTVRR